MNTMEISATRNFITLIDNGRFLVNHLLQSPTCFNRPPASITHLLQPPASITLSSSLFTNIICLIHRDAIDCYFSTFTYYHVHIVEEDRKLISFLRNSLDLAVTLILQGKIKRQDVLNKKIKQICFIQEQEIEIPQMKQNPENLKLVFDVFL